MKQLLFMVLAVMIVGTTSTQAQTSKDILDKLSAKLVDTKLETLDLLAIFA